MRCPSIKDKCFPVWLSDKYIYIMLLVFPLFTGFQGYSAITLSKFVFFAGVTVLWLAALLIWKIVSTFKRNLKKPSLLAFFIGAFAAVLCISAMFSSYDGAVFLGSGRFDGLITSLLCICVFFGVSTFARFKKTYVYALAASTFLCCLVAALQLFDLNALWLFPSDLSFYDRGIRFSGEFFGTIGNANLFSAFLCLSLPLLSVFYISSDKCEASLLPAILLSGFFLLACGISAGVLALLALIIVAAPLLITNEMRLKKGLEIAAILLLAAALSIGFSGEKIGDIVAFSFVFSKTFFCLISGTALLLTLRSALKNKQFKAKTLPRFFTISSVLLVIIGFAVVYFWPGKAGTVYEFSELLHGNFQDSFGSSRILIWKEALKLVPDNLLLGGGPGTISMRLSVDFSRFVAETGQTLTSSVDNAHNFYLGILVDTGIISLGLFLLAQLVSVIRAVKLRKSAPMLLCLICSLGCYWIQDFFGLSLFIVSPIMWLFWGLLHGESTHEQAETTIT